MTLKLFNTNSVLYEWFCLQERTGTEKHFKIVFQMHGMYFFCFEMSSKTVFKQQFYAP